MLNFLNELLFNVWKSKLLKTDKDKNKRDNEIIGNIWWCLGRPQKVKLKLYWLIFWSGALEEHQSLAKRGGERVVRDWQIWCPEPCEESLRYSRTNNFVSKPETPLVSFPFVSQLVEALFYLWSPLVAQLYSAITEDWPRSRSPVRLSMSYWLPCQLFCVVWPGGLLL